jgi:hypothetical protein
MRIAEVSTLGQTSDHQYSKLLKVACEYDLLEIFDEYDVPAATLIDGKIGRARGSAPLTTATNPLKRTSTTCCKRAWNCIGF